MPRILLSLKFWAVACMLVWIATVTVLIATNPHRAGSSAGDTYPSETTSVVAELQP